MNLYGKIEVPNIVKAFTCWLKGEGERLPEAIERTVTEGLFQRHDVIHMIGHIARSVTADSLQAWVDRVQGELHTESRLDGSPGKEARRQHVLCLHAGNLPMVGLQDLIATLLSGSVYHGKLSSKDPWLTDSLLRCLREHFPEQIGSWSVDLNELKGIRFDKVLFAGSEASVPAVVEYIRSNGMLRESSESRMPGPSESDSSGAASSATGSPGAASTTRSPSSRFLARTARFSIASLQEPASEHDPELMNQLAEAIMRYEGRGCRSVAVVVAPFGPQTALQALQRYASTYPFSHTPDAPVLHQQAYLASIGRFAELAGPMLLCDHADLVGEKDVVVWLQDPAALQDILNTFHAEVQSVYTDVAGTGPLVITGPAATPEPSTRSDKQPAATPEPSTRSDKQPSATPEPSTRSDKQPSATPELTHHALQTPEPLARAQTPPIDWKPDGVDVLKWLHIPA